MPPTKAMDLVSFGKPIRETRNISPWWLSSIPSKRAKLNSHWLLKSSWCRECRKHLHLLDACNFIKETVASLIRILICLPNQSTNVENTMCSLPSTLQINKNITLMQTHWFFGRPWLTITYHCILFPKSRNFPSIPDCWVLYLFSPPLDAK